MWKWGDLAEAVPEEEATPVLPELAAQRRDGADVGCLSPRERAEGAPGATRTHVTL